MIAMYLRCRRAHQLSNDETERRWLKSYLENLEKTAAEQKAEILRRRAS
jgi:hypothetical protein